MEDLLPVAQSQKLAARPAMLDGIVNEVVAAFGSRLPRVVALETVSSIGLWPVFVDSEQIMRALDALVANAVEAVDGQGRVYVEALNVRAGRERSEEHTSELQSLMRISYAVFCLKKKKQPTLITYHTTEE